jgi:hypothetical protein
MKTYKIIMYYVNGNYSFTEETNETFEEMVEKYQRGLTLDTIAVTGQEDKKFIVNSKNIILIQIEEMN